LRAPRLRPAPLGPLLALSLALGGAPLPAAEAPQPRPAAEKRAGAEIDPWQAVSELRLHLAASGSLVAAFEQSYIPAGFATGDEESGRVALALPDCLRWDYAEPYPKSYLLCGSRLHTWVAGEPQGERLHVDASDEAGLDLLLLPVELLKARYSAVARAAGGGEIAVELTPTSPASRIATATLAFAPSTQRPTSLAYRDRDGNATRFTFKAFELLDDATLFAPPTNLIWKEP
jgi:hypothetical protein